MMQAEKIREVMPNLEELARMVYGAYKKKTWQKWSAWARKHERELNSLLCYEREVGMPDVYSLMSPHFHHDLPLVGFNYTPAAHNILYKFHQGWTPAIRLCRGIIFDEMGRLIALPFSKFFNLNENPETKLNALPREESFEATEKMDGHLGICFVYDGKLYVSTRGSFVSSTAILGSKMINGAQSPHSWPENVTPLVEIIDPTTFIHLNYNFFGFVLIGAYSLESYEDFNYNSLLRLSKCLGWSITEIVEGENFEDLVSLMKDLSIDGREGLVVRFEKGLRVKLKFQSYINLMVISKLSYKYLMQRYVAGNLLKMIGELPEEVFATAMKMWGDLTFVLVVSEDTKERREYLYNLIPEEESTSYYRGICRKFLEKLECGIQLKNK